MWSSKNDAHPLSGTIMIVEGVTAGYNFSEGIPAQIELTVSEGEFDGTILSLHAGGEDACVVELVEFSDDAVAELIAGLQAVQAMRRRFKTV